MACFFSAQMPGMPGVCAGREYPQGTDYYVRMEDVYDKKEVEAHDSAGEAVKNLVSMDFRLS